MTAAFASDSKTTAQVSDAARMSGSAIASSLVGPHHKAFRKMTIVYCTTADAAAAVSLAICQPVHFAP